MFLRRWVWNTLVALDQFANTLLAGDPDETISSRSAKAQLANRWWGCIMCSILDWFDPGHCAYALEHDEGSKGLRDSNVHVGSSLIDRGIGDPDAGSIDGRKDDFVP